MSLIQKFWDWLHACPNHGLEHLYRHGYDDTLDCSKCFEELHMEYMEKQKSKADK